MIKILLVDDESHIRFILDEILTDEGFQTIEAENGKEAILKAKRENPDVVLLDYQLPDIEGPEILKQIKAYNSGIIIIMLTAFGDLKKAVTCMKLGAFDYLTKPFDNDEIVMVINKALKNSKLENEVKLLRKKLQIVEVQKDKMGESRAIRKVLELVEIVADNDITVFLEGETGTGKEVIARLIHQTSQRSDKPFIAVDCGAIPETLFESEMFGHEKGAFTGALKTQIGKFEQADGGTLFLDEISNLPMNMQAKLLRVIQNRSITRVGGKKLIPVNIRIIAASNMDIISDVESGNFRSDLFYRLHEFKINLPKLTERKEDIPTLADFFLREFNRDFNKDISGFAPETMDSMMKYNWPGNVRELRNLVKRGVLLAQGDLIFPKHLLFIHLNKPKSDSFEEKNSFDDISIQALRNRVRVINEAIDKAKGNKTKAASNLGITRNQLYRILNRAEKIGI